MFNLLLLVSMAFANQNAPKTLPEFRNVAVKVVNTEMSSGGTGTIVKSQKSGSIILTNKHVCQVVKNGGYVVHEKIRAKVLMYKEYERHDLCLIKVKNNFKINVKLADKRPNMADPSIVSGFPRLMPNTITIGHFSDQMIVNIMMGEEPCTEEEFVMNPMCAFLGFKPIVKSFKSQHTSNLIQPGNSGSGVFNSKGRLAGVVFAGSGELGFALIVPYDYVVDFIKHQNEYKWLTPVKDDSVMEVSTDSMNDIARLCSLMLFKPAEIKDLCLNVQFDRLYRKK